MTFSVCFIVVTFNNRETIKRCLDSIFIQKENNRVIIIDNNSQDETVEILNKLSSKYKESIAFVRNYDNTGFAKAVNQGIRLAQNKFRPDFYFLLNPDAYLEKNCLEKIFSFSKSPNSDQNTSSIDIEKYLISPIIINPLNNRPWFAGAKINWLKFKTKHNKKLPATSLPRRQTGYQLLATSYLTGCALLISKKIIQKIGLFNEKFFLYYEDADFSLRAKKAGFKLKIISKAIAYHKESQSSNERTKNYHLVKSGLIFFHKHYPKLLLPYFWLIFYLRFFYHKFFSHKKEVLQAMRDFKEITKD